MSGTNGALELVETVTACLCQSLCDSVGGLKQALLTEASNDVARSEAAKMTHRLALMRAAWGPAPEPITLVRLKYLASGLPDRVTVDISALPSATVFSALHGRILLNLLLLAADCLPTGGRIALAGTDCDLFLRMTGVEAAWPTGMAICFTNEAEALVALSDERYLQMALASLFAQAAKLRLSLLLAPASHAEPAILRLGG